MRGIADAPRLVADKAPVTGGFRRIASMVLSILGSGRSHEEDERHNKGGTRPGPHYRKTV